MKSGDYKSCTDYNMKVFSRVMTSIRYVMLYLCLELARWATRLSSRYSFIRPNLFLLLSPCLHSSFSLISQPDLFIPNPVSAAWGRALAQTTLPRPFPIISVSFHCVASLYLSNEFCQYRKAEKLWKQKFSQKQKWLQRRNTKGRKTQERPTG